MTVADQLAAWLVDLGPVVFYLVVWGLVFAGTAVFAGVFIPFLTGDALLFGAGLVTATSDSLSIWVLAIGVASPRSRATRSVSSSDVGWAAPT